MSALKHSPAPWRVKGKKGSIWNENSWIASVWGTDREANQALIIAAPTIFNMLKWVVNHDGECLGDHPELLEAARAAIARAEGRAP